MSSLVYPREQYSSWRKRSFKSFRILGRQLIDQRQSPIPTINVQVSSSNALERFRNRFQ